MSIWKVKVDHLTTLPNHPYPSILAWGLEVEGPKIYDACSGNIYFTIINWKEWKNKMLEMQLKQWLLWAQVSELTFIFVKVGYYPLLPLACTSIELLLYIVYSYPLSFN